MSIIPKRRNDVSFPMGKGNTYNITDDFFFCTGQPGVDTKSVSL